MEMPKLQDQHRKLHVLAGSWLGEETLYPSPWDSNGGHALGKFNARIDLDGFFVITDYVEERGGQVTYRGHGVYGWDGGQNCYLSYWFDSMGGGYAEPARGRWEGNVLTFESRNPMGYSRYRYQFETDVYYIFRIEMSQDGVKWAPFMEGNYFRQP
ncbi:MAG: DUF1579 family protein [Acidobacteria bacterium]|nr:DUF1579 family protein [Acidobacteriota bacterium]MBI3658156.1 DUF1579 family protein [Acidobacteriota bacterium]